MRIQLPAALQTPLLNAVGRLEINFDPRVGLRRIKRYGWSWRRDGQYAFLLVVSPLQASRGLRGRVGCMFECVGVQQGSRRARRGQGCGALSQAEETRQGGGQPVALRSKCCTARRRRVKLTKVILGVMGERKLVAEPRRW